MSNPWSDEERQDLDEARSQILSLKGLSPEEMLTWSLRAHPGKATMPRLNGDSWLLALCEVRLFRHFFWRAMQDALENPESYKNALEEMKTMVRRLTQLEDSSLDKIPLEVDSIRQLAMSVMTDLEFIIRLHEEHEAR